MRKRYMAFLGVAGLAVLLALALIGSRERKAQAPEKPGLQAKIDPKVLEDLEEGLDCQTSKCTYAALGDTVSLFGGAVICEPRQYVPGWVQVNSCVFQDLAAAECRSVPCDPPASSHPAQCKTKKDCNEGACVSARIVKGKVVIDGGVCSPKKPKALGGPSGYWTCVCTPF